MKINCLLLFLLCRVSFSNPILLESISNLDPSGDEGIFVSKSRQHFGYQTKVGTYFKRSCKKILHENGSFKNIEMAVNLATQAILNCKIKYPELEPYLLSWINRIRRTNVSCSRKEKKNYQAAGVQDRGLIEFQKNIFLEGATKTPTLNNHFVRTLIHEVLHSTPANNFETYHHNAAPIDDRVYFISDMCTNGFGRIGYYYRTMVRENSLESCVKIFTKSKRPSRLKEQKKLYWSSKFRFALRLRSASLSVENAINLCQRIIDYGPYRIQ